MIKNEHQLARILRDKLLTHYKNIYINTNLASNKFYPQWKEWHGQPVPSAQPEIDLLLVDSALNLLAVELKYFRKTKRGELNLPFYAGIGQALALLRFGFSTVGLWHFFDKELDGEDYRSPFRNCELLVSHLELPINYRAFRVSQDGTELELWRLYPEKVESRELPTAYGTGNPFESGPNAQKIQDFLRAVLRIPHPR